MDDDKKVFTSDILRANNKLNNNLYDLIHVVPAKPLPVNIVETPACDFIPRCDKYYVAKKKNKLKVKTIRHIREKFEADVYTDLNSELDKQRNVLLRKIRIGSAREEATKKIAKNILSSDYPVSKDIWHMVINLNPEGHIYSAQYVLWNGKSLQINGSKGGKNKFICKHDLGEIHKNLGDTKKSVAKRNVISNRKKLLQNSLYVKFRPGPLSKKKFLDSSYQKFQSGNATVVNLPKPAIEIQPSYDGPLGPQMTSFLNKTFMRNSNGEITKKWADFSVSVLGVNKNGCPIQTNKDAFVTFDLQYKCRQNKILMRNSVNIVSDNIGYTSESHLKEENGLSSEVKNIMSKILDYVEFNLDQGSFYKTDEDTFPDISSNSYERANESSTLKDKCKRKYGELDRLDVTIIKIPGNDSESPKSCKKIYCSLGCICESLEFPYTLKTHCGRVECMFNCRCSFSKTFGTIQSLHGLIDLDNKILNSKLAKEEQKFCQTVVVSGEGNIVFNSQKRNWKASKKYADFYSKMCLKTEPKIKKDLCIVTQKLECSSIEPWCMVHNLYKCFCKGKFTEKALPDEKQIQPMEISNVTNVAEPNDSIPYDNSITDTFDVKSRLRVRSKQPEVTITQQKITIPTKTKNIEYIENEKCARIEPYKGRKFSNGYYLFTNRKIIQMEQNDRSLVKKLLSFMTSNDENECRQQKSHTLEVGHEPSSLKEFINDVVEKDIENNSTESIIDRSLKLSPGFKSRLPSKTKLVAWLEASYKQYKEQVDQGIVTTALDAPKVGKVALYPWEFILNRYRERKNLFLITKQKPYRILMAVNTKNPFFENCININEIVLTDLEKYPVTVKNLLTNATDLKDYFCILCGLTHCWELIGSVTKVKEPTKSDNTVTSFNCDSDGLDSDKESINTSDSVVDEDSQEKDNFESLQGSLGGFEDITEIKNTPNDSDLSKWFVMTVENDFSEIHFYNKGFFVKYDGVIKAINVTRRTGKTVRLSSQKCNKLTVPQFGIYTLPNESDHNVFIGPYERHEHLGIETVKTDLPRDNARKTRGTWIMVNKVDNVKIIDQPLDFLSTTCLQNEMISLENEVSCVMNTSLAKNEFAKKKTESTSFLDKKNDGQMITKMIKPIKISKSNNVFHLVKCYSKPLASQEPNTPLLSDSLSPCTQETIPLHVPINILENSEFTKKSSASHKPIAEIAPQGEVVQPKNYSKSNSAFERSMFILKPEEINKRSLLGKITTETCDTEEMHKSMDMDIENFLATSTVCKFPNTDILIISDEEDDEHDKTKSVWIQSTNVEKLGWISAKRNGNNDVCFEFPGFKCTDFYPEKEAFQKLNSIFSRKVFVPKHFKIEWEVVQNESDLRFKNQLKSKDLRPELVITKRGLRHKHELMNILKLKKKLSETEPKSEEFVKRRKLLMELEDYTSESLEDDSNDLLNKTISKKGVLLQTLSGANDNLREEMSAKLNALLSDSDSL